MGFWYRSAWLFFRAAFALYFRWRVLDARRVPAEGPVILAANHASYIDPPLVGTSLPRTVIMLARKSLFRFPGFGRLLRRFHAVPVDPDAGSAAGLKILLDRLASGNAVLIFPEGSRTFDGRFQPGRAGLGLIVIKSGAPVVPVRIWGSYEAFGRQARWPRPKKVILKYGRPMPFEELREEAVRSPKPRFKEICQEIADRVMAELAAMEPVSDLANRPEAAYDPSHPEGR